MSGIKLGNGQQVGVKAEDVMEIGTAVRYWPYADYPAEFIDTVTRSEPWMTGSNSWLVSIKGKSGGCSLDFMLLLADAQEKEKEARR